MSYWTDAHCHLQDRFFEGAPDAEAALAATLTRTYEAGVRRAVVIGTDRESSTQALALVTRDAPVDLYATVGLHPHDAASDLAPVAALARAKPPRLVGIGECGLDYYYEHSSRADQMVSFAAQIGLAHELDLALVIHARDAFDDLFAVLDAEGAPSRTVIHCFTGTPAEAEGCLERGLDLSISGVVTFKNAETLREAVKLIPLERLHVETDSPFLAPVPHRGRPNEPALVSIVGEFVAELRGEDVDLVRQETWKNTARLFNLPLEW
ncbi:MAG: TatD family hydrolase [Acidobacteriota bacterium]|nr:TatD family hydrolase [Acidobacteriota bacterium]MDE3222531.1 TatD family hydrolase [Acidobacteriota bacterium]